MEDIYQTSDEIHAENQQAKTKGTGQNNKANEMITPFSKTNCIECCFNN